ncbi:hypothetical protein EV207_103129 [Scopulibacillus darangshiensis]|uniref:Uncharacterized protein n=1 Tax=Scopulibacillus darangshiensis TaxID=442528 RepID=A0A4V2SNI7_9BACL|nr:hypothetical protein [Scopulibacillus darangshiensis]TCP31246.1 hypothetical protein EV207_103129 [Scopulibacillus darangshiensis]
MLEALFNIPNDPAFYTLTLTLFFSLSLSVTWTFLFKYYDSDSLRHPKFVDAKYSARLDAQNHIATNNSVRDWISQYIKRKVSPGDDSDDHHFLLNIS